MNYERQPLPHGDGVAPVYDPDCGPCVCKDCERARARNDGISMPMEDEMEHNPAKETDSLGTALPREMARVRDEVLPVFVEIGISGAPAAAMMRADLDAAAKALAEGDVVEMIRVYESLKGFNL